MGHLIRVIGIGLGNWGFHVCADIDNDSVWCWGFNDYGQLGDGDLDDSSVPVRVIGLP